MPVSVAVVGPPGSGRTTLFHALTGGREASGVGMVGVPDERLEQLAEAVHPKKVTPAQIRVSDAPPGSRARQVAAAREADVLLVVARCFGPDPDPAGDLESVQLDLVLADLASVEKRLEMVGRELRVGKKDAAAEAQILAQAKEHLDRGLPLRTLPVDAEDKAALASLFPVSSKPSVLIANVSDAALPGGGEMGERVLALAQERGEPALVLCASLEMELAELEPAEAAQYRASYEMGEGLGAVARAAWGAGGLITFFTAGEPEVRAWPVFADAPAPIAAGVIHSDFERQFIRAEVTSVDELVRAGSMEALRGAGQLRVEGRDYRVKDGDVVFFRVGR